MMKINPITLRKYEINPIILCIANRIVHPKNLQKP
jgi:hypothetical protein